MDITFKYNNLSEGQSLSGVVEQKLRSLEKYLKRAESVIVEAEFQKVAPQQNGQVHRFEVNMQVDGALFRADATEESFEKAIDEVRAELDKELRRSGKKKDGLVRRGGRAIKAMLRRDS